MTANSRPPSDSSRRGPRNRPFCAETVERRVLLSATWVTSSILGDAALNDNLVGTAGDDLLDGLAGDDSIYGLGGNDVLIGGEGNDFLDGGAGQDLADYSGASGAVGVDLAAGTSRGAAGNDTLTGIEDVRGSTYDDVLVGDSGANVLDGNAGNDVLQGGGGDDVIHAGDGDDTVSGGTGYDTVHYGSASSGVTVDLTVTAPQNTQGAGRDALTGIEAVVGSGHDDTFVFSNPSSGSVFTVDGGAGVNTIDLSNFDSTDARVGDGFVEVATPSNGTFRIDYTNIDSIRFADSTQRTSDVSLRPTADAGDAQTVDEGDLVTLDGGRSSDPDNDSLTYQWRQVSGPTVTLSDPAAASPTFVAPEQLTNTAVSFELTVSDGVNTSTADTVTITLQADDDAPAASAGANQVVNDGDTVTLDASGSRDPEGTSLTYSWRQISGPTVSLSNAGGAQPTFTAPDVTSSTRLGFEVTVSDGVNASVATVAVVVDPSNEAPMVTADSTGLAESGGLVRLSASASDADGDRLTYRWTQVSGPRVQLLGADDSLASFTAPDVTSDTTMTFSVEVSDGIDTTLSMVNVVVMAPMQRAPDPTSEPEETTGDPGLGGAEPTPIWTTPWQGSDAGSDPASELTPEANRQPEVGPSPTPTATEIEPLFGGNGAFGVQASGSTTVPEGTTVRLFAETNNAGGGNVQYSWRQVSGPPVTLDGASGPSPSFVAPSADEDYQVAFEVSAAVGSATASDTVVISVQAADPVPTPSGDTSVVTGDAGQAVQLVPRGAPSTGPTEFVWRQVSGTPVSLGDSSGRELAVVLPEVFVEEDLVFEVVVRTGAGESVEEVVVRVLPVQNNDLTALAFANGDDDAVALDADAQVAGQRGIGMIWAALLGFLRVRPFRLDD